MEGLNDYSDQEFVFIWAMELSDIEERLNKMGKEFLLNIIKVSIIPDNGIYIFLSRMPMPGKPPYHNYYESIDDN